MSFPLGGDAAGVRNCLVGARFCVAGSKQKETANEGTGNKTRKI